MVETFTPQELSSAANQGFGLPFFFLHRDRLPAYHQKYAYIIAFLEELEISKDVIFHTFLPKSLSHMMMVLKFHS